MNHYEKCEELRKAWDFRHTQYINVLQKEERLSRALESPMWQKVMGFANTAEVKRALRETRKKKKEAARKSDKASLELWKARQAWEKAEADTQYKLF